MCGNDKMGGRELRNIYRNDGSGLWAVGVTNGRWNDKKIWWATLLPTKHFGMCFLNQSKAGVFGVVFSIFLEDI